ncbi:MAG: ribosome hibernation-promoting factor, HPF/YfiA family [Gemmatimonadota bacterium]
MQVIVSARHFEVSDTLRSLIDERFSRLVRFEPRILRVEVTLLEEKNRCEVEAQLAISRADSIHAHAEASEFRTAIDRVIDKLSRQLKKSRSRRRDHKAVAREATLELDQSA